MNRVTILLILLSWTMVIFIQLPKSAGAAECVYCSCDGGQEEGKAYGWTPAEQQRCASECSLESSCEYPVSCESQNIFAGMTPPEPIDAALRLQFPNLTCYTLHTFFGDFSQTDWSYNSLFGALQRGDHLWMWEDIDRYFGDRDGRVTDNEFDSFFRFAGYERSENCARETGKMKVALYGRPLNTTPVFWEVFHLAFETYESSMPPSETWWESKLGASFRIFHLLNDLSGAAPAYGEVFRCYAMPDGW